MAPAQISSVKPFEPDVLRSESELLSDIEGMDSQDIMKILDEEFERHEEVGSPVNRNFNSISVGAN